MCKFVVNNISYHQYQSGYKQHHSILTMFIKLRNDTENDTNTGEVTLGFF